MQITFNVSNCTARAIMEALEAKSICIAVKGVKMEQHSAEIAEEIRLQVTQLQAAAGDIRKELSNVS